MLTLDPDRLLPADASVRAVARRLYESVQKAPIISPHGHVDPAVLLTDEPFPDPAALFIQPDHYVTRILHAHGVALRDLGVGEGPLPEARAREVWRVFCRHWAALRGTPVQYWLASELHDIFGVTTRPGTGDPDALYDEIAARLATAEYRPQALLRRFGIRFLATTDDPADDLAAHAALAALPSVDARIVPTFRPDRYLEPAQAGWGAAVRRLGEVADADTGTYGGYLAALEARRRYFIAHGAVSADHGHADAGTVDLGAAEAGRIYSAALAGTATEAETVAFRRHMVLEMARMSCDDGLVMTVHPGVYRNHHPATRAAFGPDTGHDIPVATEFTRALQPLLERYGTHPGLHLVLFTVDPSVYAREIGPLAGFYPSVYAGAPWWFLDNPSAIRSFQAAVTETAGFGRLSGFIDDTRAFCSIPARHDMSRRLDAGFLAGLVAEHRLDLDEAVETIADLAGPQPARVFKL